MKKFATGVGAVLAVAALAAQAHAAGTSHADHVARYDGTRSCTACHEEAAKEVASSLHYQQQAVPQFLEGWEAGKPAGMMTSY